MPHQPSPPHPVRPAAAGVALATLLALAGCGERQPAGPQAIAPPPSVVAVPAKLAPVDEQAKFVGRVAAVDRVELRARVQGFLKERRFDEGQKVAAGDVLFVIEPDQYQATLDQRNADIAKAEAEAQNAKAQLARGEELLKSKNISAAEVDKLRAGFAVAQASIAQAKAAANAAELDLSYTAIKAPVTGRVGFANYSVGNLVGPDSGTLAIIVSHDPIHVEFPVTQKERLKAKKGEGSGGIPEDLAVRAKLPDGSLYDGVGKLDLIDVTAQQGADTVLVRAVFPNPNSVLLDGQYIEVAVQGDTPKMGIIVPQSALQIDQQGTFVFVVDAGGKAEVRRIELGPPQGAMVAVNAGLKEGELVITDGVQKVRPGQVVKANPPAALDQTAPPPKA